MLKPMLVNNKSTVTLVRGVTVLCRQVTSRIHIGAEAGDDASGLRQVSRG